MFYQLKIIIQLNQSLFWNYIKIGTNLIYNGGSLHKLYRDVPMLGFLNVWHLSTYHLFPSIQKFKLVSWSKKNNWIPPFEQFNNDKGQNYFTFGTWPYKEQNSKNLNFKKYAYVLWCCFSPMLLFPFQKMVFLAYLPREILTICQTGAAI